MNEKIFERLVSLIGSWGAGAQVIGLMLILFSMAFFTLKDFRSAIINSVMLIMKQSNDNPEKHPFFLQRIMIALQVDRIHFIDKDKTWLFQTLLRTYIETTYELVDKFINEKKWKKINRYQLQGILLLLLKNIEETAAIRIEQKFTEKYGDIGKEIFQLVYCSQNGFKIYHDKNIEMIERNITKIFVVESFNNSEILNSFILQIWVAIDTAINDCVITFQNLNGNLKSIINKYYGKMEA